MAGALTQGVTRNPLGAPGILGINAGAAFAVVGAIYLVGISSPGGYVWFAFGGALGATLLVYAIASAGADGATPIKLALAGAIISALAGPLGFVALLVSHIARSLAGALGIGVMTLTVLLGAVMLLGADLAAQRLIAPTVPPAGVMTAAMGGPCLLWVLRRFNRAA